MTKKEIEEIRKEFETINEDLKKVIKGRDELIDILTLALASKQHILIKGKQGEAKTLLSRKVGEMTDLKQFDTQFHRETKVKDVVGNINPQKFQEGEFEYMKTKFWDSEIQLYDEFLRGRTEMIDFLLEVMEERQFSKDSRIGKVDLPVLTVIAVTNPLTDEYNTERLDLALKDRFSFIINLNHLVEDNEEKIEEVIDLRDKDLEVGEVSLDRDKVEEFRSYALDNIDYKKDNFVSIAVNLKEDKGVSMSTRLVRRFRENAQVLALLEGEEEVTKGVLDQIAHYTLENRYEDLSRDDIDDVLSNVLLESEHKETLQKIEEIKEVDDKIEFVERSIDLIEEVDEEYRELPDRLQEKINDITTELKFKMQQNKDLMKEDLPAETIEKLDTERFSDIKNMFKSFFTIETRYLSGSQREQFENLLEKHIDKAMIDKKQASSGDRTKYTIEPTYNNIDSFDEVVLLSNEIGNRITRSKY